MDDLDIYSLASDVLNSIVRDLQNGIYAELGGTLSISWNTEPRVVAWAASAEDPDNPPEHSIVFSYELARQFYRDAEEYYEFAVSKMLDDYIQTVFPDSYPKPGWPEGIGKRDSIKNMFLGAITWVFFHEIGHLVQEHGYIRKLFGDDDPTTLIEDCQSDGKQNLQGRAAVISHATEFAADVEAIQWCLQELTRHFLSTEGNDEQNLKEFESNLYLLVSGISCAFYRFHGERPTNPEEYPEGSHPTPIRRLEVCLPNIFEVLDFDGRGQELHGLNRIQLVELCIGASHSAGLFWLFSYVEQSGIPENFMTKGLLQDPFKQTYWNAVVMAWDELEPEVKKIRRFGSPHGLLSFTTEFRSKMFEASTT